MLVLSRHTNQKVLFPNLGISVQVVETRKGVVRLGIEAPPEIRIIRDELMEFDRPLPAQKVAAPVVPACESAEQFRRHLDAANLAIHLARNQLRQGLDEHAGEALNQALESLQALEQSCSGGVPTIDSEEFEQPVAVRESALGYHVAAPLRAAILLPTSRDAACNKVPSLLADRFGELSIEFDELTAASQLVDRVRDGSNLDLVVVFESHDSGTKETVRDLSPLTIPGVCGLSQKHFPIGIRWAFSSSLELTAVRRQRTIVQRPPGFSTLVGSLCQNGNPMRERGRIPANAIPRLRVGFPKTHGPLGGRLNVERSSSRFLDRASASLTWCRLPQIE